MVIISPYSRRVKEDKNHSPKDYPYWKELIGLLKSENLVQIGTDKEECLVPDFRPGLSLRDVENLVKQCKYWISVDNFLQHMAHHFGKPGVVLWGVSDPVLFGYNENLNLLKSRSYLRHSPFDVWDDVKYKPDAFLKPQIVMTHITRKYNNLYK